MADERRHRADDAERGSRQPPSSRWDEDEWDRGSWDGDDWDAGVSGPGTSDGADRRPRGGDTQADGGAAGDDERLLPAKGVRYTPPGPEPPGQRRPTAGRRLDKGETVAFMLLAGIGLGAGIGYGIDRLVGTFPALMVVGVFLGFGIALYAVFLEAR